MYIRGVEAVWSCVQPETKCWLSAAAADGGEPLPLKPLGAPRGIPPALPEVPPPPPPPDRGEEERTEGPEVDTSTLVG